MSQILDKFLSHPLLTWPQRYPSLFLVFWVVPLLLVQSTQQSFMAHDEGIYASQAKTILDSGDWIRPGEFNYDRTIGIQWIIALCFQIFGQSEGTARLPSIIAALVGVLLTYHIGTIIFKPAIGFTAALILAVTPLWAQYSRLATQDMVLVSLELLSIWALLQGEQIPKEHPKQRSYWTAIAGFGLGFGFFIKGFMVVPVVIALLPYFIAGQRRHRYLTTPTLYLGAGLGLLPMILWLWLSVQRYGDLPLVGLFGKLFFLSQETFNRNGPLFYLWNIPVNSLPWIFFSLVGLGLLVREMGASQDDRFLTRFQGKWFWICLGYPGLLFIELMVFKTRTRYYPLQLTPFLALLAAIALEALHHRYQRMISVPNPQHRPFPWISVLSYGCAAIAALLIVAGVGLNLSLLGLNPLGGDPVKFYGQVALGLGVGWLLVPLSFWWGKYQNDRFADRSLLAGRLWQRGWLVGPWLAIALLGLTGLWGDYNPDLKAFLRQPEIVEILDHHPIHQVKAETPLEINDRKTALLLEFYVPEKGAVVDTITALSPSDYAWLQPGAPPLPPSVNGNGSPQVLGSVRGWQLIQVP